MKNDHSKIYLLVGFICFSLFLPLKGDLADCYSINQPTVEAKVGYFVFSNSKMRRVYNQGNVDVQLCATYPLCNISPRLNLAAYGAIEYLRCGGHSLNDHQRTTLSVVPVNIGLQPSFLITPQLNYYLTVGPRFYYVQQHNLSHFIYRNKSRNGVGLFANTGFKYYFEKCLFLDLFCEYSYAKTHFHTHKTAVYTKAIEISGFTFGGGVGYAF